jgi:hypothetical protein
MLFKKFKDKCFAYFYCLNYLLEQEGKTCLVWGLAPVGGGRKKERV